jgi:hypothetical protein
MNPGLKTGAIVKIFTRGDNNTLCPIAPSFKPGIKQRIIKFRALAQPLSASIA